MEPELARTNNNNNNLVKQAMAIKSTGGAATGNGGDQAIDALAAILSQQQQQHLISKMATTATTPMDDTDCDNDLDNKPSVNNELNDNKPCDNLNQTIDDEDQPTIYGELSILGYNGYIPNVERNGRKNKSKYLLCKRPEANGIKKSRHYIVKQQPQATKAIQDKDLHSISFTFSRSQTIIVEYGQDENTDMFQIGRSSEQPIDFVVMDTFTACSTSDSSGQSLPSGRSHHEPPPQQQQQPPPAHRSSHHHHHQQQQPQPLHLFNNSVHHQNGPLSTNNNNNGQIPPYTHDFIPLNQVAHRQSSSNSRTNLAKPLPPNAVVLGDFVYDIRGNITPLSHFRRPQYPPMNNFNNNNDQPNVALPNGNFYQVQPTQQFQLSPQQLVASAAAAAARSNTNLNSHHPSHMMATSPQSSSSNNINNHNHDTRNQHQAHQSSNPQNDQNKSSSRHNLICKKPHATQSTISRFACRIIVDRKYPYTARIYAAGFDSSKNIFLGEKATKWEQNNTIDGLTTNGVLLMHPKNNQGGTGGLWREVSVHGGVYAIRESRSATQKGTRIETESNVLQDGTLIDLCGATLLWRSVEGFKSSPTKKSLEEKIDLINASRPQCPVGLNTLIIPRKPILPNNHQHRLHHNNNNKDHHSSSAYNRQFANSENNHQPYVYLKCGHVQGYHDWGATEKANQRTCPICLSVGTVAKLSMGLEPSFYIDSGPLTHVFNPCGHMASEKTVNYWCSVKIPHGTHFFHSICPFCATPLTTTESSAATKLIFQDDLD